MSSSTPRRLAWRTATQSPLEEKELNTKYVFDLVYNPAETRLIRMARAKNLQVISGLEMFVQQGARQFEIWTGKPAPVAEMGYVVTKTLERRAAEEMAETAQGALATRPPAKPPKSPPQVVPLLNKSLAQRNSRLRSCR